MSEIHSDFMAEANTLNKHKVNFEDITLLK